MKKTLFILASIAAIFVGCAKVENDTTAEPSTKTITLKVRADDITTKATYSSTTGQFTWAAGDQIGVHAWVTENTSDTWPQPMTLKSGAGSPEGEFEIQGFANTNSYGTVAFYPWNGWDDVSDDENGTNIGGDGKLYVHLKPTVSYANSSANPMHVLPLAAQISNGQTEGIQFKHLGAGVMVTINDVPAKANKVSLTIPGKNITGWYTIEPANIGTTALVATDGDNSTVSITFDQGSGVRDMSFVFPIPTLSLSGLTIGLYNSDMLMWSKSASAASATTLSKGDILSMPEFTVPATKTINVGIISYLLSDTKFDFNNCKVRYWGGLNGEGDASLTTTGNTEQKAVGSSYWDNNLQTFTMFKAEVPVDITGFKVYDATNNRWFGDDASSSTVSAYIFNYSGDKAYYE